MGTSITGNWDGCSLNEINNSTAVCNLVKLESTTRTAYSICVENRKTDLFFAAAHFYVESAKV